MNRRLLAACIGGWMALGATTAQAGGWHVDLFYGGGGYHHHHHHNWHAYHYWPRPYYYVAPPPVVYTPAPTVVTVPVAQAPAAAAPVAQSTPAPAASTQAVVRSNPPPVYRGGGVTIKNPIATGTSVGFVVDDRTEAALAPGDSMPLVEKGTYVVEFDRGGDFGTTRRTLSEGAYEFTATASGWDLRRSDDGPVPTPTVRRNALPTSR